MQAPLRVICAVLLLTAPLTALAQTTGAQTPAQTSASQTPAPQPPAPQTPAPTSAPQTQTPQSPSPQAQQPQLPSAELVVPIESTTPPVPPEKYQWLDEVRALAYQAVWESAMHVDRWFGSEEPDWAYEQASGSLVPGILWSRFYGEQTLTRFLGDVPLPQLSDSLHAFIGRLNPEEFISESQAASGALPNPYAPSNSDQTIFGIQYNQPLHPGAQWDTGAGLPVTFSRFDPYFKGGYLYEIGSPDQVMAIWRQDAFYHSSQGGFGVTNRLDVEKFVSQALLLSWTVSTTYAQRSYGWNSYSTLDAYFSYNTARAIVFELDIDDVTQAQVPLQDYGGKVAFRRSILRDWLILEVRASLDWPKYFDWQHREISPGVGVAFEMEFGARTFLARPVTF